MQALNYVLHVIEIIHACMKHVKICYELLNLMNSRFTPNFLRSKSAPYGNLFLDLPKYKLCFERTFHHCINNHNYS